MVGISVIIPVYNVSNYLQNAIDSIDKQTFEDIEIVCVNDGSNDNSLEVLNNLKQENEKIKIVNQENSGPGIARNLGINYAKGEYIAFLDADDIFLDEDALEKMYNVAKQNDADLVCGNLKWINQDYTLDKYYDYANTKYQYSSKEETITSKEYGTPFAFYKNIFKKEVLNKHNICFPNMRAGEDPIFMTNVLVNIEECYMVPVDLYGYNHSIGGGVNEKIDSYDKKLSYITHFKEIFDILKENNYDKTLSLYKNEFVLYYLIYSNNMQDKEVIQIVRDQFTNFEDYFDKDDFGYFILDYIINNEEETLSSKSLEEFKAIKKSLFEQAVIKDNYIEPVDLKKYVQLMDEDRYSLKENNLTKTSYDVLNNIKTSTDKHMEEIEDEVKELKQQLISKYYDINSEFLRKYVEARIDIKNWGGKNHDVILLNYDNMLCSVSKPSWFTNSEGKGMLLNSTEGNINFSIQCVKDGTLVLSFRGIDYRDKNGNRIPIYVDYTEIIVDGVNIVGNSKVAWHDNPFHYEKEVKDGQIVNVRVKWRPLNYNSDIGLFMSLDELSEIVTQSRIDIKNSGNSKNDIKILDKEKLKCTITQPDWFIGEDGKGVLIESNEGKLDFSMKCIGDGDLSIEFRSRDYRDDNNNRIPVLIKYTYIKIDEETITDEDWTVWHDDPIIFKKKVKDGQIINVKSKWSVFNSNYYEVEDLLSEKKKLLDENNQLRDFRESVLSSNSWKLTSPLRMIKKLGK